MKKSLMFILVICLTFCLTSCGSEIDKENSSSSSQTISTTSETNSNNSKNDETSQNETNNYESSQNSTGNNVSSNKTESVETPENGVSIEITQTNFNDYFFITFSVENCHGEQPGPGLFSSLCDLRILINSKTAKHPENLTVTIRIDEIVPDGWTLPGAPITTKTLMIPYNGTIQFSVPIQKNVVGGELEKPNVNNFKYTIQEVSGSVK